MSSDNLLNRIKKIASESGNVNFNNNNIIKSFDDSVDKMKEEFKYNIVCSQITDLILLKVVELVSNDNNIVGYKKGLIISATNKNKDSVKDYVLNMNSDDAHEMIINIKKLINNL